MTIEPPYIASSVPISALFDYRAVARSMSDSTDHPPILYHYTDKKDRSMSRHPGFAAYKARTGLLFPWLLPVRAQGTDRTPAGT